MCVCVLPYPPRTSTTGLLLSTSRPRLQCLHSVSPFRDQFLSTRTNIPAPQIRSHDFWRHINLCMYLCFYVHKVDAQGMNIQWRAYISGPAQSRAPSTRYNDLYQYVGASVCLRIIVYQSVFAFYRLYHCAAFARLLAAICQLSSTLVNAPSETISSVDNVCDARPLDCHSDRQALHDSVVRSIWVRWHLFLLD